jgi:hypothetical protein
MATQPLVNGNRKSFASVEIDIKGRKFRGITEINYSDTLEPGMARGASPIPLGHTQGDYEAEASLSMFREEFEEMMALLGDGYGEVEFPITVTHSTRAGRTTTDRLPAVRIKGVDTSHSQGTDPTTVKIDLTVLTPIERDGKRLVSRDA